MLTREKGSKINQTLRSNLSSFNLFRKYFEGRASPEESERLIERFDDPGELFKCEQNMRLIWDETAESSDPVPVDLQAQLNSIHHKINVARQLERQNRTESRISTGRKVRRMVSITGKAAAILLLPVLGYIGWQLWQQNRWLLNQPEVTYHEIICPLGARSTFELPDGTRGSLNNGSRLKYPVAFSGELREVELSGEAFFDVTHRKDRPFMIRTGGLDVKVLGTRLNVYSYPGEGFQEFTLESGSIELIRENQEEISAVAEMKPGQHLVYHYEGEPAAIAAEELRKGMIRLENEKNMNILLAEMKPGQRAVIPLESGEIDIKQDPQTDQYTSWKDGKLVLRNDPLPKQLKRIERWYNVEFNVLDERINEYPFWATFEEENLDEVLNYLSLSSPIEFIKHPREILQDGSYKPLEIDVRLKDSN